MLTRILDLIDALQYVNFLATAILELFGLVIFFLFRDALRIRRNFFWGLVAIFVFVVGWRELLGIPGRRYYVMSILASLPFALIPVMIDWDKVHWSPRWKLFGRYFLLLGTIVVLGICIGRNLKPEKSTPVVAEFGSMVRESFEHIPARGTILLLDNTTRGRQFAEAADLEYKFCWIPNYKEEERLGRSFLHIRDYLLAQRHMPLKPEIILFFRTADLTSWRELEADFQRLGYEVVARAASQQRPEYYWVRFQRSETGTPQSSAAPEATPEILRNERQEKFEE